MQHYHPHIDCLILPSYCHFVLNQYHQFKQPLFVTLCLSLFRVSSCVILCKDAPRASKQPTSPKHQRKKPAHSSRIRPYSEFYDWRSRRQESQSSGVLQGHKITPNVLRQSLLIVLTAEKVKRLPPLLCCRAPITSSRRHKKRPTHHFLHASQLAASRADRSDANLILRRNDSRSQTRVELANWAAGTNRLRGGAGLSFPCGQPCTASDGIAAKADGEPAI